MNKTHTVPYRRKREGRTDYRKRLKLLLSGKPRLTVRVSLRQITAQIITYSEKGDSVAASVSTRHLKAYGWPLPNANTPGAYLLGMLIARKAKEKGVSEAILDIGLKKSVPGSTVFAVLKGAVDSGMQIPHSDSVLPSEERIKGEHIAAYAGQLKENKEAYEKRFSAYLKAGVEPSSVPKLFEQARAKLGA